MSSGAVGPGTSRRRLLLGGGVGLAAGVVGTASAGGLRRDRDASTPQDHAVATEDGAFVDPFGDHQAGSHRPATPPAYLDFQVYEAPGGVLTAVALQRTLAALGEAIGALARTRPRHERLSGPPEELTVQIGLGARALSVTGIEVPLDLPEFAGSSAIAARLRRGDVVVSVAARRPEVSAQASDVIGELLAGSGLDPSWGEIGYRPRGRGRAALNPLGFDDGIVQPTVRQGVPEHVFLEDAAIENATVGVVRRFTLDTAAFAKLATEEQEAVVGRDKTTGAPLSGGSISTAVNLGTKTPTGEYLVPIGSHVRAAHPSFTGSSLMLRRSYGFRTAVDGGPARSGLLFISYQNDVDVFVRTQARMDREDRLMEFATPTAELAFLVLPGFTPGRPLGSSLFG